MCRVRQTNVRGNTSEGPDVSEHVMEEERLVRCGDMVVCVPESHVTANTA